MGAGSGHATAALQKPFKGKYYTQIQYDTTLCIWHAVNSWRVASLISTPFSQSISRPCARLIILYLAVHGKFLVNDELLAPLQAGTDCINVNSCFIIWPNTTVLTVTISADSSWRVFTWKYGMITWWHLLMTLPELSSSSSFFIWGGTDTHASAEACLLPELSYTTKITICNFKLKFMSYEVNSCNHFKVMFKGLPSLYDHYRSRHASPQRTVFQKWNPVMF